MFDDHYWVVGGDETKVWSSRLGKYVPIDDQEYLIWLNNTLEGAMGEKVPNLPTHIESEESLNFVLERQGLQGPIVKPVHVKREAKRRKMAAIGQTNEEEFDLDYMKALAEGTSLTNKVTSGATLTATEQARKTQLEQFDALFASIDAKMDALLAMSPIPQNYKDDIHWQ